MQHQQRLRHERQLEVARRHQLHLQQRQQDLPPMLRCPPEDDSNGASSSHPPRLPSADTTGAPPPLLPDLDLDAASERAAALVAQAEAEAEAAAAAASTAAAAAQAEEAAAAEARRVVAAGAALVSEIERTTSVPWWHPVDDASLPVIPAAATASAAAAVLSSLPYVGTALSTRHGASVDCTLSNLHVYIAGVARTLLHVSGGGGSGCGVVW
jgi:hypothetical protein